MALPLTGLEVESYEEILDSIVATQKELISSSINYAEDTLLGQLNAIMSQRLALLNELAQDVYDQRNILVAEGKALDDNVSWLGIVRQSAAKTSGEQLFVGADGTIIPTGSIVRNEAAKDNYTLDQSITISRSACRKITISILTVSNNTAYTISVNGTNYTYTSDGSATKAEIITGLVALITAATNITAVDNGNETFTISTDNNTDMVVSVDVKTKIESVVSAGNISCTVTGTIAAPALTVTKIITPVNGWTSTYNLDALVVGREIETDFELRERALLANTTSGKATVDSIRATILALSGVASCAVNERFLSQLAGDAIITVNTVTNSSNYSITINSTVFSYTSDGSATDDEITAGLCALINATNNGYAATDNADGTFTVYATFAYRMTITVSSKLTITQDSQPAGSIQLTIGGNANVDAIAQGIWDSKPAGVEVWAYPSATYESGNASDESGTVRVMEFNRPTSVTINVNVEYYVFNTTDYPATDAEAYAAIKAAIVEFGNKLGAGVDVSPAEFEGAVYGSVDGIYRVFIEMDDGVNPAVDSATLGTITIAGDEEAYFDVDFITVTKLT